MATFTRFEDIESWQKGRHLARSIYSTTSQGPFARDYGLRDQIRRSAVSIMANIAAGFGRGGNREFVTFLSNARGSCAEVKSHLYVALDCGLLPQKEFDAFYSVADETEGLISGLMKYLANSEVRGRKFKQPSSNRKL
jgi:four helix bundle protein